ncbi:MAG: hypothetical protein ACK4P4_08450 [Allorhizobium sp.]
MPITRTWFALCNPGQRRASQVLTGMINSVFSQSCRADRDVVSPKDGRL